MPYSRKQKTKSRQRHKMYKRSYSRTKRASQKGGAIISPAVYSNSNNAHFSGIGFTDPTGAVTGCTGGDAGNIYTTIGGIRTPVNMKGGRRYKCVKCSTCKTMKRLQRGGNTNGYSIGGVNLKPSLSGIANNYYTPFDSCKG